RFGLGGLEGGGGDGKQRRRRQQDGPAGQGTEQGKHRRLLLDSIAGRSRARPRGREDRAAGRDVPTGNPAPEPPSRPSCPSASRAPMPARSASRPIRSGRNAARAQG